MFENLIYLCVKKNIICEAKKNNETYYNQLKNRVLEYIRYV